MLKNCFYFLALSIFFIACKSNKASYTKLLNKDSLTSQFVTIYNSRDTIFQTANGAIIKIEKESFSKENVKLEIKEAYSIEQMILAGLTTESGGKPLSSGGMMYINAVDDDVAINKPIDISIPSISYDNKMQLYKGEEENEKIDWIDPKPLSKDTLNEYIKAGKNLFQTNCASCHALDKALSGPALSGVEGRGPWNSRKRLIEFTRNPAGFIPRTCYTINLQKQYGSIMPSYSPQTDTSESRLSDKDIHSIYDYIKNEDMKKGIVYSTNYNPSCDDSCYVYKSLLEEANYSLEELATQRQNFIDDNGDRINFERDFVFNSGSFDTSDYIMPQLPPVDKVEPIKYGAVYYKFNIETFGWYNVDQLINTDGGSTELKVEMQGEYKKDMSVFIVVPGQKVFAEGGPLDEENVFGFYTRDGKIDLPSGSEVIVFAMGEKDGLIFFDYKKFNSTDKQRISLTPKVVSKKEFNKSVKKFRLGDASIKAEETKNAEEIKNTDKEMKNKNDLLLKYKPKNCDCDCGREMPETTMAADSIKK
jgi:mono/diheme cytochrome c family protein